VLRRGGCRSNSRRGPKGVKRLFHYWLLIWLCETFIWGALHRII
jgi:hypothetical protein